MKDSRPRSRPSLLKKLPSKDLPRFIALGLVCQGLNSRSHAEQEIGNAILKRLKIDPKKVDTEVRATLKANAKQASKPSTTKGKK